jgi:hypothetical protein
MDVSEKGKQITLVTYQKGSIAAKGDVITLDITSCVRVEGENKEERCSPNRYVVHMNGAKLQCRYHSGTPFEQDRYHNVRALSGGVMPHCFWVWLARTSAGRTDSGRCVMSCCRFHGHLV